jgi:hypothetical protein
MARCGGREHVTACCRPVGRVGLARQAWLDALFTPYGQIYSVTKVETGSEGQPAAADALRFTAIPKYGGCGVWPGQCCRETTLTTCWMGTHKDLDRWPSEWDFMAGLQKKVPRRGQPGGNHAVQHRHKLARGAHARH